MRTQNEALEIMQKKRRTDTGKHLCYSCVVGYLLLLLGESNDLSDTTVDLNACRLFAKSHNDPDVLCVSDNSGNTRVYLDGLQTRDNGGGYWVVGCPYRVPYPHGVDTEIALEEEW